MPADDLQIPLLEVAPFAAGPARPPRPRRMPRVRVASLTLPFEARAAEPRAAEASRPAAPRPRQPLPPPEPDQQPEERVLVGARRLGSVERARLEAAFEAALGSVLRRRQALVMREANDHLELLVEAEGVRARFSGRRAIDRWLVTLQRVGREHGLVEPD